MLTKKKYKQLQHLQLNCIVLYGLMAGELNDIITFVTLHVTLLQTENLKGYYSHK